MSQSPTDLYLELLKRSILNHIYAANEALILYLLDSAKTARPVEYDLVYHPHLKLRGTVNHLDAISAEGTTPREFAHSMAGRARLDNVHQCLDRIRLDDVAGDLLEAGVWKGGMPLFMRGYLKAHGMGGRTVWLADSFEGVPPSTHEADAGIDLTAAAIPWISVSEPEVAEIFRRYDLLDDRVRVLKGWFKDTLPKASVKQIALLRIDGDLYESTRDALAALYDRVVDGGFVIVDDYGDIAPCRRAVDEFRRQRGITAPIERVDWTGVFWRKG